MHIKRLKIEGHEALGDLEINLSAVDDDENKKTILIGPNGTGKSRILGGILDIVTMEWSRKRKN